MHPADDPFFEHAAADAMVDDDFGTLRQRPATPALPPLVSPAVGTLRGFDLLGQPLVGDLAACTGEVVAGRSTVALRRALIGRQVLVLFAGGDVQAPVIVGVIEPHPLQACADAPAPSDVAVHVDGERRVIEAEREVVLRCGDASITLTRAGKVLIKGNYISSRSAGYNKIKGAAVEIN